MFLEFCPLHTSYPPPCTSKVGEVVPEIPLRAEQNTQARSERWEKRESRWARCAVRHINSHIIRQLATVTYRLLNKAFDNGVLTPQTKAGSTQGQRQWREKERGEFLQSHSWSAITPSVSLPSDNFRCWPRDNFTAYCSFHSPIRTKLIKQDIFSTKPPFSSEVILESCTAYWYSPKGRYYCSSKYIFFFWCELCNTKQKLKKFIRCSEGVGSRQMTEEKWKKNEKGWHSQITSFFSWNGACMCTRRYTYLSAVCVTRPFAIINVAIN